jgi:hypothetical protein
MDAGLLFNSKGTYTITVLTEKQKFENGTVIKLNYEKGIATILPDFELILNSIGNKQVDETQNLIFTASITDSQITDEQFSLEKQPNGATINKDTGAFSWTPTNTQAGGYIFDIIVKADILEDRETIAVTVADKPVTTPTEPEEIVCPQGMEPVNGICPDKPVVEEPKDLGLASFVDETKDPQSYVDRYNNEATYKEWFDDNFAEYDSIYQAVGLDAPIVKEKKFGICGPGTKLIDGVCTIVDKPSVKPWWQFW